MIRFLNDETVGGYRYGMGAVARFDDATEAALIAQGDAEDYPAVSKPVEVLSSSAVAVSCATTAADEILESFTIPTGIIGVNSIIQIEPVWTYSNGANNKLLKVKVNGTTVYTATRTTSVKEAPLIVLANRNSLQSQIQPYGSNYEAASANAPATHAINMTNGVTVEITGQRASGGDTLTLEYYRALHFVGD